MIDEGLVSAIARALADVSLAPQSAQAAAQDVAVMLAALRAQRGRLRFEDGPRDFERLLRCNEGTGG